MLKAFCPARMLGMVFGSIMAGAKHSSTYQNTSEPQYSWFREFTFIMISRNPLSLKHRIHQAILCVKAFEHFTDLPPRRSLFRTSATRQRMINGRRFAMRMWLILCADGNKKGAGAKHSTPQTTLRRMPTPKRSKPLQPFAYLYNIIKIYYLCFWLVINIW